MVRPHLHQPRLLAASLLLSLISPYASSTPFLQEEQFLQDIQNTTRLVNRGCQNPCGYNGWLCCGVGQQCYTDAASQAQCGNGVYTTAPPQYSGGPGYWQYWTSTWVQTDLITVTSVYSSWCQTPTASWVAPSTTANPVTCNWASGESSCGNICCTSSQYCAVAGQCADAYTSSFSPAVRPTSQGVIVATATVTTATQPFIPAVPTAQAVQETSEAMSSLSVSGSSSSLSGGAIAGIVIGVILGILILIIICLFLCFRGAWHALLAIFGLGPRRRRKREVTEEYYRHGSRSGGRNWHGDRESRVEKKKKSGGLGWGGVLAGLGGLAVALGLRRRSERRRYDEKSDYTSSSYDYSSSYDTSSSSDRRTRDTRRSRR